MKDEATRKKAPDGAPAPSAAEPPAEPAEATEAAQPREVQPHEVQPHEVQPHEARELALEEQLESARAEAAAYLDDLKRLKAEFENYRKRALKEQTHIVEYATRQMIDRLLPVLDNFELALLAADRTQDYSKLVRGVELVFGELLEILHKEGLQKIEATGRAFDPELHEAVLASGEEGEGDPVVTEVVRPGYRLKGRVIRPAMVKVGHRGERAQDPE